MPLALHGPRKAIESTKNFSSGTTTVGFSVSKLQAAFHAFKNAYNNKIEGALHLCPPNLPGLASHIIYY